MATGWCWATWGLDMVIVSLLVAMVVALLVAGLVDTWRREGSGPC